MKKLKWNGEKWYYDERSLWKRCRQWIVWIGGWEKANGKGWRFLIEYGDRKGVMSPAPISLIGHHFTWYSWGWQVKFKRGCYLVWSISSGLYISNDGTPPHGKGNTGFFLMQKGRKRRVN